MPQNKFALARYVIIDELLQKNAHVKSAVIADTCRENLGYEVSQRTIQLDMHSMKHDTFLGLYAPIDYCTRRKAYFYEDKDYRLGFQQFDLNEINLLENACTIAQRHMMPEQNLTLQKVINKIKKRYMAK